MRYVLESSRDLLSIILENHKTFKHVEQTVYTSARMSMTRSELNLMVPALSTSHNLVPSIRRDIAFLFVLCSIEVPGNLNIMLDDMRHGLYVECDAPQHLVPRIP
jgi:hypothetical protein